MSSSTVSPAYECDYEECRATQPLGDWVVVVTNGLSFIWDGVKLAFCSERCVIDWLEKHDNY